MIGRIWAVTLTVADLDRAVRFYEGVLLYTVPNHRSETRNDFERN